MGRQVAGCVQTTAAGECWAHVRIITPRKTASGTCSVTNLVPMAPERSASRLMRLFVLHAGKLLRVFVLDSEMREGAFYLIPVISLAVASQGAPSQGNSRAWRKLRAGHAIGQACKHLGRAGALA